ncbi:CPBP family intramembrane glutamic endopeptidase [Qipengyuania sphaerica]|uniref:CPBP family intramembrane glutamic endopeptidase n=1 Tax=Qipengyuania sphaerica TaxID=2867243 RepID=UPI001C8679A6|nr:type II CAAX endopeptidase family protein [Qipengyuania sphaerica]MBX7540157.1 CPBP family intramembrane metalloprotease [Qipengyuania sphaerica]
MTETAEASAAGKSTWRKIYEFPLVALLLGLLAFLAFGAVLGLSFGGIMDAAGYQDADAAPEWLSAYLPGLLLAAGSVLLVKLVIRRLGAEPRDDLPFDSRFRDFFIGILFAAVLMSAIVAIAALLGGYRIVGWGGSTSIAFIILLGGFQAAFFEEILFRGVIFRFLEEFFGSWIALALSALLFGLVHWSNPNGTLFASIAIAVEAGILLGAAYMLTRNLWLAIGLHWGWNVVQGYIWDVSVSGIAVDGLLDSKPAGDELISGGAFGLEASVVAMVIATGTGLWLLKKSMDLGHLVRPWWVRRREQITLPNSTGPVSPTLGVRG